VLASWSRRLPAIAFSVLVLAAGLAVRALSGGAFAKYAGVALYASFAFGLVLVVAPRLAAGWAGAIALAWSWAVEFAQLTPGPATLSQRSGLARLVLGSTFNAPDLVAYAVGVLVPMLGWWLVQASRAAD
jgi:uncharacterized protein DUF2809